MSDRSVRVAVVGAGDFGRNHARVYRQLEGVELVGVVDADLERAHASPKSSPRRRLPGPGCASGQSGCRERCRAHDAPCAGRLLVAGAGN